MRGLNVAALAAAMALALTGAAQATVATITFDGTVVSGVDQLGLFGAPGVDLTGDAFSTTIQFDTSLPDTSTSVLHAFGGSGFGKPFPFSTSLITIGSQSFDASSLNFAAVAQVDYIHALQTNTYSASIGADSLSAAGNLFHFGTVYQSNLPLPDPSLAGDTLTILGQANDTNGQLLVGGTGGDVIKFHISAATAAPVIGAIDTIPEPGLWAMLIVGFGVIGTSLRGRRAAATA
jgi:type 1 fimbria pilin